MIRLLLILSVMGTIGVTSYFGLSIIGNGMSEYIGYVIACAVCSGVLYIVDRLKNKWLDRIVIVLIWMALLLLSYVALILLGYGMNPMRDMIFIIVLNGVAFALTYWSKKLDLFLGRK